MVDTVRVAQQYVEVIEVGLANPPVRVIQQYIEVIGSDEFTAPSGGGSSVILVTNAAAE